MVNEKKRWSDDMAFLLLLLFLLVGSFLLVLL